MDVVLKATSVNLSSCQESMRRQELIAWQQTVPNPAFTSSSEPLFLLAVEEDFSINSAESIICPSCVLFELC